jgi:hypothetical protein
MNAQQSDDSWDSKVKRLFKKMHKNTKLGWMDGEPALIFEPTPILDEVIGPVPSDIGMAWTISGLRGSAIMAMWDEIERRWGTELDRAQFLDNVLYIKVKNLPAGTVIPDTLAKDSRRFLHDERL